MHELVTSVPVEFSWKHRPERAPAPAPLGSGHRWALAGDDLVLLPHLGECRCRMSDAAAGVGGVGPGNGLDADL